MSNETSKEILAIIDDNARLLLEMGIALRTWDNTKYLQTITELSQNQRKLIELGVKAFQVKK